MTERDCEAGASRRMTHDWSTVAVVAIIWLGTIAMVWIIPAIGACHP